MNTHRLVVTAFILREDRFLLLHRKTPPILWAPPGGHLREQEPPLEGLRREVREETRLEIDVPGPLTLWSGDLGKGPVVSLDFACQWRSGEVCLSSEHDDFCWSTLEEIHRGKPDLGTHPLAFKPDDFETAFRLFRA